VTVTFDYLATTAFDTSLLDPDFIHRPSRRLQAHYRSRASYSWGKKERMA